MVSHSRLPDVLSAVVHEDHATPGEPILFAQALEASMAAWPGLLAIMEDLGLERVTSADWTAAMSHGATPDRMGVYLDNGGLHRVGSQLCESKINFWVKFRIFDDCLW